MTREEASTILYKEWQRFLEDNLDYAGISDAYTMAINTLKQEPCGDAISRQAVMNVLCDGCELFKNGEQTCHSKCEEYHFLATLPSITPQSKTGHWILADKQNKEDVENDNYRFICSECQCSDIHAKGTKVPYCWKCGSKMESES